MTGIEKEMFVSLESRFKWLMVFSKFIEIKEMANLMSDKDIKFAETLLRDIWSEVKKS